MKKKQSTNSAVAPQSPTAYYKGRVAESYAAVNARGGEFLRAVVAFGALLDEVAGFLGTYNGGVHDGDSLQAWLGENCPEVNYNTAMGYKALAGKCAKMIGGGSQAIAALQGRDTVTAPGTDEVVTVDAEIVEKRDALFEKADSRRKLEQLYFDFMAEGHKRGRKKGEKRAPSQKVVTPMDAAREKFAQLVVFSRDSGVIDTVALWDVEMLSAANAALSPLLAEVKKRLADAR